MKKMFTLLFAVFLFQSIQAQSFPDYYPQQLKQFISESQSPWSNHLVNTIQNQVSADQRTGLYGDPPSWKWANKFGGDGLEIVEAILEDSNGDVYCTGNFSGTVEVGGIEYTSHGLTDMFVAKLNSDGDPIWFNTYNCGSDERIKGTALTRKPNGAIYIAGYFNGTTDLNTTQDPITSNGIEVSFLGEMDTDGNFTWYRSYFNEQKNAYYASDIETDIAGNIYLLIGQNPGRFFISGTVTKFDAEGDLVQALNVNLNINEVAKTSDGLYFAGSIFEPVTIDGVEFQHTGWQDGYIAYVDNNMDFQWQKQGTIFPGGFGDSNAFFLFTDSNDNAYFGGIFGQGMVFDGVISPSYDFGIFYASLDTDGNVSWVNYLNNESFYTLPYWGALLPSDEFAIGGNQFNNANVNGLLLDIGSGRPSIQLNVDQTDGQLLSISHTDGFYVTATNGPSGRVYGGGTQLSAGVLNRLDETNTIWSFTFGSNSGSSNYPPLILKDEDNDTYLISSFSNTVEYGGEIVASPFSGIGIAKTDVNGQEISLNAITSDIGIDVNTASLDQENNIIIAGNGTGNIQVGSQSFTFDETTFFITKINGQTGEVEYFKTLDPLALYDMDIDAENNIILSGSFFSPLLYDGSNVLTSNGAFDIFYFKIGANGDIVDSKGIGGSNSESDGLISVDSANNLYITFRSASNTLDFGNGVSLTLQDGDGDLVLVKYDKDGNAIWANLFGGSTAPSSSDFAARPRAISTSSQGDTYITGEMGVGINFGNIQLESPYYDPSSPGAFINNQFLVKVNTEGELVWANMIHQYAFSSIGINHSVDEAGNLYITGAVNDSIIYFSTDAEASISIEDNLFPRTYLAKYDSIGQIEWLKAIDGSSARGSSAIAIAEDQVYLSGTFFSVLTADAFTLSSSSTNVFLLSTTDAATFIPFVESDVFGLTVSPNPFNDNFVLNFELKQKADLSVRVLNNIGQLMHIQYLGDFSPGQYQEAVNLTDLASGTYFINLISADKSAIIKVVKI